MVLTTCRYIADLTTPEERPTYLARLEAFLAAAYIFGPAIGGFLGEIKLGLPFLVAGVVAGITLIIVIFILNESLDKSIMEKNRGVEPVDVEKEDDNNEEKKQEIAIERKKKEKKTKKYSFRELFPIVIVSEWVNNAIWEMGMVCITHRYCVW